TLVSLGLDEPATAKPVTESVATTASAAPTRYHLRRFTCPPFSVSGRPRPARPALLPPPPNRGMPAQRVSLAESDHAVESDAHDARDEDRGPRSRVPCEVDRPQYADAPRVAGP